MGLAAIFNGRANPTLKDCYVLLGLNIDRFNLFPSIFGFGLEIFIRFITGLLLKFLNLCNLRSIPQCKSRNWLYKVSIIAETDCGMYVDPISTVAGSIASAWRQITSCKHMVSHNSPSLGSRNSW